VINYPYTPAVIVGAGTGLSISNPNNNNFWMESFLVTETSAQLRTYVYEVTNILGQNLGWIPTNPANVTFSYTVLSAVQPQVYLQNDNVTTTRSHASIDELWAGNNVTASLPQGDYVVKSGANVSALASGSIFLKPGFRAENGSVFRARTGTFFTCATYPGGRHAYSPEKARSYFDWYNTTYIPTTTKSVTRGFNPAIYPNPFRDKLTIEYTLDRTENVSITLSPVSGQKIIELNNSTVHESGTYKIDFEGLKLPEGAYILQIKTNSQNYAQKVICIK
jgi:hypothetical protein